MNEKKTQQNQSKRFVTLPAESGHEDKVIELVEKWGADAIRDSDGTQLSDRLLAVDCDIYSTLCLVRADQEYAQKHPEFVPRKFLMSTPVIADTQTVEIVVLSGFSSEKYEVDAETDPHTYWEVIDRTTGDLHPADAWSFDAESETVSVSNAVPFHLYTVNFLVRQVWDSVSMYNALVNEWAGDKVAGLDPYYPKCRQHLMTWFDNWLETHPHTDIVRFTTFAYQFVIDSNEDNSDKYRDWLGYGESVSVPALMDFKKRFGYAIRSEDFVDEGYYNSTNRPPSQAYLDWMTLIHEFVVEFAGELVAKAHQAGKRTAMFQGDHWIGTETFSKNYERIGIDINIGAVEDGVALRRLSDSPGPQVTEARFYPYFFPDVFCEGGDPVSESLSNWVKIRRALLRMPIDRIGYGGYLSLALKFPKFIDHVTSICDDFGEFLEKTEKSKSLRYPVKVAVLSAWGSWRSWLQNQSIDQKFHIPSRPDVMEFVGSNPLECLAGLPFDVSFMSFRDIKKNGIPEDIDVIINTGVAGTSWSGGYHWADAELVSLIRGWVRGGGGFVGIDSPTEHQSHGRCFQLADVLGVEKETGNTLGYVAQPFDLPESHFILDDSSSSIDFGTDRSYVFPFTSESQVLAASGAHVQLSTNECGRGRSTYLAGVPYSLENSRLLMRSILWAAGKEDELKHGYSENLYTDCAVYPETDQAVVVNNTGETQETIFHDADENKISLTLKPYETQWIKTSK